MGHIIEHMDYDYNGYCEILTKLCREYNFLKYEVIGKSVFGRAIPSLRIGDSGDYVLYTAATHGSERITTTVLLRFVEELCDSLKNGKRLSEVDINTAMYGRGIIFVPIVNPDGCEISLKGAAGCVGHSGRIYKLCGGDFEHWNANLRGVDINHNFDAGWKELHELERQNGYFGPGPTRYGGQRPMSEPETLALAELCQRVNIRYVMSLHSQGEVIYWDYDGIPTHRGKKMAEIFAASSGYALDVPTALAQGGGFKDWFIKTYRRPGFTVEIGKGKNPLNPKNGEKIYEQIKEMLTLGLLM